MTALSLIRTPGGRVIPLPARRTREIGDGALALGLQRMLANATGANALSIDPNDVADIHLALAEHATYLVRRDALLALARWDTDWRSTPQGRVEMRAFLAFIAPACTETLWRNVVAELEIADDALLTQCDRERADHNLHALLAQALAPVPDGPGAA